MSDVSKKLMQDGRFVAAIAVVLFVAIVVELGWALNYKPPVESSDVSSVGDSSELQELLLPKSPLEKQQPLPEPWRTLFDEAKPAAVPAKPVQEQKPAKPAAPATVSQEQSQKLVPHDAAWYVDRLRVKVDSATTPQARHDMFWAGMCVTWNDLGKPSQKNPSPAYDIFTSYSDQAGLYLLGRVMDGDMPYRVEQFLKDEIKGPPKPLATLCTR